MDNSAPVALTLTNFANQLIHSSVWALSATEAARIASMECSCCLTGRGGTTSIS